MIEVEHLTKHYGDHLAVSDIGFRVRAGEIVGFLGPNGAGKSTTLRMLTGYLLPNEGRIRIGGQDALAHPLAARRLIGYMPESVPLYRELRVREYLRYRAALKGVPRRDIRKRIDAALEMATVADVRDRIIGQLSKGYRSRVGLADALLADPPILVLDEPTAGLDPNQIRQVRDLIRSMAGHKAVLVSTHILPEVESTCGRVLILNRGQLVGEGTPEDLRMARIHGQVVSVVGRGERDALVALLKAVPGVLEVLDSVDEPAEGLVHVRLQVDRQDVAESIFAAVAEGGMVLRELRREQTSLEDVFTHLTTTDRSEEGGDGAAGAREKDPEEVVVEGGAADEGQGAQG